jgi:acetyl esterase
MPELQTILPDTRAVLDQLAAMGGPKLTEVTPPESREMFRQMSAMMDLPVRDVPWTDIDAGGVPARLYAPASGLSDKLVIYFHGGGWVFGDTTSHHGFCSWIAEMAATRVLSVDYRLAPEHAFPAAHDDALAVTRWAAGSPAVLGAPVRGIGLAGDSAGGNMAAVTALALKNEAAVPLVAQWLIYPATDLLDYSASYLAHAEGYLLERETMDYFRDCYAPDKNTHGDIRLSPLRAPDVSAVVPAVVLTCGLDPLRDEGRAYAARLVTSGVPVQFHEAYGQIHGVVTLRGAIASAQAPIAAAARDFVTLLSRA